THSESISGCVGNIGTADSADKPAFVLLRRTATGKRDYADYLHKLYFSVNKDPRNLRHQRHLWFLYYPHTQR
ncbi:hypothetical protein KKC44_02075, partial [Patescibacteria group bacterium]|nr:hypothetical protein [Patescibacteria group bacterium]